MTTAPRSLTTPAIESQTMATSRTTRAGHALLLVDLATDAASGHPGQRATIGRCASGTAVAIIHRDTVARYVWVELTVAWDSSTPSDDGVTVSLSITDGTTTVSPPSTAIPIGLDASLTYTASLASGRAQGMGHARWALDLEHAGLAALTTTVPWMLVFTVTVDPGVYCESILVREVPRFLIDDTRTWGETPGHYLPRAAITARLSRLQASLETAVDKNRRTYCHVAKTRVAAWQTTASSDAAIPGTLSESVGMPTVFQVHPRRILTGNPAVVFGAHYKTSGASNATLKLHSGGTGAAYTLTLPATSGAWSTITTGAGSLYGADEDTLWWTASIAGGGTLSLATLWVADDP